ncbi:testis-specific Y-encoded protein 9-like [Perognathus longimembris pacificus]|uniref:testis-specific Y-encoded protein 9-like n=1 Tax=Perognathus longimembris pacificus TaxID=214514 RepID=UPI002019811F|nr:testis-specific Y-encoded protein 9-like [Perognathus longimembris pacificus]
MASRQECGTPPPAEEPPLKELQALQLDLGPVNNQATKAHERLKQNLSKRQKTLLDSRSSNIRGIPGFWAQTFVNHPQLSAMISDQDEDMLSYMINLEVQELRHPKSSCKITFYFRNNPYFQNAVVVKEFVVDITGYRLCHSTPILWRQDYKIEADSHRNHNKSPNFFNWFTDHNFAGSNRITEIIRKDLWLNPLHYYKMMKAHEEGLCIPIVVQERLLAGFTPLVGRLPITMLYLMVSKMSSNLDRYLVMLKTELPSWFWEGD